MFNPISLATAAFNNYVNFWENASTRDKICAHTTSAIPALLFRVSVCATPKNIGHIYEIMAVIGLVSHFFVAITIGKHAKRELGPKNVNQDLIHRFNSIDQQLKFLSEDVKGLRSRMDGSLNS